VLNPEIDHVTSILPRSNLGFETESAKSRWVTDGAGLGDGDDILMLTTRNEHEPFVGRSPTNVRTQLTGQALRFHAWGDGTIESTLAEVVWFSLENPGFTDEGDSDPSADGFFGEPGMRTIYRRALLIAPWLNPYRFTDSRGRTSDSFTLEGESDQFQARPGLLRILIDDIDGEDVPQALASLVAFQDRYDLSVRLEFDPNLGDDGRWVILANTLADLTKRENRFEHHLHRPDGAREYPYAVISTGGGYDDADPPVICWPDLESPNGIPEDFLTPAPPYTAGHAELADVGDLEDVAVAFALQTPFPAPPATVRQRYRWRPYAYVDEVSDTIATARVILNDDQEIVRIVHGLVPLSGERRGEDVMMTGVLAFDLRVYDPGAPLFATWQVPPSATDPQGKKDVVLAPSDPGWLNAYMSSDNMGSGAIGTDNETFPYIGQGAYVDLGYGFTMRAAPPAGLPPPVYASPMFSTSMPPWFFVPRALGDVYMEGRPANEKVWSQLAPGYAVYDTWSFHYENNGLNEDQQRFDGNQWVDDVDTTTDEGTNGLEDGGNYSDVWSDDAGSTRLGVDDVGERETAPPYDKPLRGLQALIRTYEIDSRAIRQVRVNQHFMQE
jgi:hypothetical protein